MQLNFMRKKQGKKKNRRNKMATRKEIKEELDFVKMELGHERETDTNNYNYLRGYLDALEFSYNKKEE